MKKPAFKPVDQNFKRLLSTTASSARDFFPWSTKSMVIVLSFISVTLPVPNDGCLTVEPITSL